MLLVGAIAEEFTSRDCLHVGQCSPTNCQRKDYFQRRCPVVLGRNGHGWPASNPKVRKETRDGPKTIPRSTLFLTYFIGLRRGRIVATADVNLEVAVVNLDRDYVCRIR